MRALLWVVGALGMLLALLCLVWFGYNFYVERFVSANPSTQEVIRVSEDEYRLGVYSGGDQVPPAASPIAETPVASGDQDPSATPVAEPTSSSQPTSTATPSVAQTPMPRPILPPTKLTIPKIGVAVPVVLADNENLPRFKAAGWFLGTGYPGFRGNVVLFGHLNGEYETLGRLHELVPSDEVIVHTEEREYHYRVTESRVVPATALGALAPTRDYRLTLITCTGTFIPRTRDYSHRLVVLAR